jgi:hypothetical protein
MHGLSASSYRNDACFSFFFLFSNYRIAAVVIIVELAVALRQQQDQFRVAIQHVENIHHQQEQRGPSQLMPSLGTNELQGRASPGESSEDPPLFALLDNDMHIMSYGDSELLFCVFD